MNFISCILQINYYMDIAYIVLIFITINSLNTFKFNKFNKPLLGIIFVNH